MNGAVAQGSARWSCRCLSRGSWCRSRQLRGTRSFSFGKGNPTRTRICQCPAALPLRAGPTPAHRGSRAVCSVPKLLEALLQQWGRRAQQPAHSSQTQAPLLLGLERLPAALPLQKLPPTPCPHPLMTVWLLPGTWSSSGPSAKCRAGSTQQQRLSPQAAPALGSAAAMRSSLGSGSDTGHGAVVTAAQGVLLCCQVCFDTSPASPTDPISPQHINLPIKPWSRLPREWEGDPLSIAALTKAFSSLIPQQEQGHSSHSARAAPTPHQAKLAVARKVLVSVARSCSPAAREGQF